MPKNSRNLWNIMQYQYPCLVGMYSGNIDDVLNFIIGSNPGFVCPTSIGMGDPSSTRARRDQRHNHQNASADFLLCDTAENPEGGQNFTRKQTIRKQEKGWKRWNAGELGMSHCCICFLSLTSCSHQTGRSNVEHVKSQSFSTSRKAASGIKKMQTCK